MEIVGSVVDEGITDYRISFIEVVQAAGVLGVIGILFLLGLKVFKLLPTEARAFKRPTPEETASTK